MRVLFLVYSPQKSFEEFSKQHQTNFPWVDALIKELYGSEEITIGLVVPVKDDNFRLKTTEKISIYGVPEIFPSKSSFGFFHKWKDLLPETEILSNALKAIDDFAPDIIHVFGTENIFGLIQQSIQQPVVIHFQGSVLVVASKWFAGITRWEQIRALTLRKLIYRYGNFFEYFTFRARGLREENIMRNSSYFLGRTSFDQRLIKLLSPGSTYFFCNEFLRKEFFETKWSLPLTNQVSCISILKGVTYKGLDLLFDTLFVLNRYSSLRVEFKICGVSENEEVVSIVRKRHGHKKILQQIRFLGKLNTTDLIDEMKSANLFIHPSYIENSPNSVCEAMALGMPVIATNAGGTNSLINDGHDGILVQEGEPYSMAAAIIEMSANHEAALLIGKNARERAMRRHQPEILREELVGIYKNIISHNRAIHG